MNLICKNITPKSLFRKETSMKTLVLFYSFTGKTKAIATKKAAELGADIFEIKETKKRNIFSAFTSGAFSAIKQKKVDIQSITTDLNSYEKIIIIMPIWASAPAPAFNSLLDFLPGNKSIELICVSGSGKSNKEKVIKKLKGLKINISNYMDIKANN